MTLARTLFDASSCGSCSRQTQITPTKHPFDAPRARNKLSLDLFREIPNLTSIKSQFVDVYITDMTARSLPSPLSDFVLVEVHESVNVNFIRDHGLDPAGEVYKAQSFVLREV